MKRHFISPTLLLLVLTSFVRGGLPEAAPGSVGLDSARLDQIDAEVEREIAGKRIPGAVVLVGRHGKIAFARSYGLRKVDPGAEKMTRDTIFDMASLTKPMATATSIMVLMERGKLRPSDKLRDHLPEFDNRGKGGITIEQLLRHQSGLMADNALADYKDGPAQAWRRLAELPLDYQPGERFLYSDVNFEILGRIVERLSGQTLDRFADENVFKPLGMSDTSLHRIGEKLDPTRFAPTEKDGAAWLRGVVHDPRSRALGGVAGHAGLFSTADDTALYARMLLDGGKSPEGRVVLSPLTVRLMTDPGDTTPGRKRGLGWDIDTGFSGPRGTLFGPRSFGHTGFTGTSLWIDPETDTFIVILSNRVHPDGKGNATPLRARVATIVASAVTDVKLGPIARSATTVARGSSVREVVCGIDVLVKQGFRQLRGKRVALVTNHTGLTRDGVPTIDVLNKAPEVRLVRLFSPEHGIRGIVDAEVSDSRDEKTGLPIISLYGKTRKPSREMLKDVDIVVYDIQDIGARFYTYVSTMGLVLESAAEAGIPVMILDRPNPIGGIATAGPVRDPDFASFIAHHALPVRHGMTVGELARMFNAERFIGAKLTVIPCEGWHRADTYDKTGLRWVNPSPNMRSLTEAVLYPGVGLLEASNLATGRGTDTPFERVGAPYIDSRAWSKALNDLKLSGFRFVPIEFSPKERQFAGKVCKGVNILVADWSQADPVELGIGMAYTLKKLYPQEWKPEGFLRMLADRDAYEALLRGRDPAAIRRTWESELAEFRETRSKYLLYP